MGNLGAYSSGQPISRVNALTLRQAQHHQTFIDVFNQTDVWGNTGRGDEIVRCFAGQFTWPGGDLQQTMNALSQYQIPMDVYLIADYRDYIDEGYPNPCATLAAASIAINNPLSLVYGSGMAPWTMGQYLDYYRHCLKYDLSTNGPNGYYAQNQAVLATYQVPPNSNQPSGYIPLLMGYEGGLENLIPHNIQTGPDSNGFLLYNQLGVDLYYHPEMLNCVKAHFSSAQDGGLVAINLYQYGGGINGDQTWSHLVWGGQSPGDGSTNKFWLNDGVAHHLTNRSVKMQAYRDWANSSNT